MLALGLGLGLGLGLRSGLGLGSGSGLGLTLTLTLTLTVAPKVLFTCDGFVSAGKKTSIVDKVEELVAKLPSLERVVVLGMTGDEVSWDSLGGLVVSWEDFLG